MPSNRCSAFFFLISSFAILACGGGAFETVSQLDDAGSSSDSESPGDSTAADSSAGGNSTGGSSAGGSAPDSSAGGSSTSDSSAGGSAPDSSAGGSPPIDASIDSPKDATTDAPLADAAMDATMDAMDAAGDIWDAGSETPDAKADATEAGLDSSMPDAQVCLKTEGEAAGRVCHGCGWAAEAFFHCDGTRGINTSWDARYNDPACLTKAHCGGESAFWAAAFNSAATCDSLCSSLGATCGNECSAYGNCPGSNSAGYNQSETYGCDSAGAVGNQCSSTIAHAWNAFNAACCCRGLGTVSGGAQCVKTEGSEAGYACFACGFETKTYFHCNGTRYMSDKWYENRTNAICMSAELCSKDAAMWVRNMNGSKTCSEFCASVNATCDNACTAFGTCPASTTAGYNQHETYGCDSKGERGNQCSSEVAYPSAAYNAHCCCRGFK